MTESVERWRKHVATVERELKNAAAPPKWWTHLWSDIFKAFSEPLSIPVETVVPPAEPVPPHEPVCTHPNMRETTLGAVIRKPKVADRKLLGIAAEECPDCKMVVARVA